MLAPAPEDFTNAKHPKFSTPNIQTLIVDDLKFDRRRLDRMIAEIDLPIETQQVSDLPSIPPLAEDAAFDVVFIDHDLEDGTGFDAMELLRKTEKNAKSSFIMITGNDDLSVAFKALKEGCSDYIPKSELSPERLRASILLALEEHSDALKGTAESAEHDAIRKEVATNHLRLLQPEVAGLIRQIRTLRSGALREGDGTPKSIEELEKRCMTLWDAINNPDDC